ncbi:glycoside hydrolase family 6 protein [Actinoplanes sp. M2I2]|uniref:glycoside hydrolase family 6 protein n=1 Tax=Actinoplanes sp. M2I2 TaxID=1734444 RepID=UPI0020201EE9|nr:glycoside hydrolase family 6 protein [Actinoplanes sp. M2I2]
MSPTVSRRSRRLTLLAASIACATAGVTIAGAASAGTLSGTLYRDPDTAVARWVAANPNDSRTSLISSRIASQPATRWLSNFNLGTVQSEVSAYVGAAAAAGRVPALTLYGIPNRDCGGASAGGAPDLAQYQTWVNGIARGLAGRTTLILLEPDSIALQTCLSAGEITARDQALATATRTLKAAGAKVYLDGGHSAWNSGAEQARRLANAGVADGDGFYTNASNFQSTANEAAFGRSVLSALSGRGITGKRQVIDTSRNGGAAGDWCGDDNTDRRIGRYPTLDTGDANIDAYLWIKPPGEADGCAYAAGSFQPALAASLATGAAAPPNTPSNPTPPTSAPTTPPTTPPTGQPAGACGATYVTSSTWQGGFQGQITVKAGGGAVNGWSVSWTLGSGQSVSQVWGGTLSVSGSTVTVRNAGWNGSLQPGATAEFGFIASGAAGTPGLTCTA